MFTGGCRTTPPPLSDKFYEIYKEEYSLHEYDCSNKSAKYANLLKEAGYEADIIAVDDGVLKIQIIDGQEAVIIHALVRVVTDKGIVYCDVTNGTHSRHLSKLGYFYLRTISWEEIETNKEEYGF
jgi:hypothetical protein